MTVSTPPGKLCLGRLIFAPALISLGVTLLRLAGELLGWSEAWFTRATLGIFPAGMTWLFGITWLALPFGAWFGWKLAAASDAPPRPWKVLGMALLGMGVLYGGLFAVYQPDWPFPQRLIPIWLVMVLAGGIQLPTWPTLFKTLTLYGWAARLPVVVVMFLAMQGNWGTHYDYFGMPPEFQMDLWPRFFWLAFFPQLIFWVGYTILLGLIGGGLALALYGRRRGQGA